MSDHLEWLRIAKSNLAVGKSYHKFFEGEVRYEEFCFDLQQCAEKSLKALLLFKGISFPKTHVISHLTALLEENGITLPEKVIKSTRLTSFAVRTRYPDDYIEMTEEDYKEAVEIAEYVYNWVNSQINTGT